MEPNFLEKPLYQQPKLKVTRQPQKRGYRFRYHSEGLTHGGIRGEPVPGEKANARIFPSIKLHGYRGKAKVVLTIVTTKKHYLHAHSLIVDKKKTGGFHVFDFDGQNPELNFQTVAIQHVVKEKLVDTLMDRILQTEFLQMFGWSSSIKHSDANKFSDLDAFTKALQDRQENGSFTHRVNNKELVEYERDKLQKNAENLVNDMIMNKCCMCFQVFLPGPDGHFSRKLEPVYSDEIFDGKTKHGAALKIMRMSKVTSAVSGDEEVWLIADKLAADDLEVRFFEDAKPDGFSPHPWEGFGRFQKTDVLKQTCLIFRTPEYHDKCIEQPVHVHMQLRRKTDPDCISEPQPFKYTPIRDRYGIGEKRKKQIPMDEIICSAPHTSKKRTTSGNNNNSSNNGFPLLNTISTNEMMANARNMAALMNANPQMTNFFNMDNSTNYSKMNGMNSSLQNTTNVMSGISTVISTVDSGIANSYGGNHNLNGGNHNRNSENLKMNAGIHTTVNPSSNYSINTSSKDQSPLAPINSFTNMMGSHPIVKSPDSDNLVANNTHQTHSTDTSRPDVKKEISIDDTPVTSNDLSKFNTVGFSGLTASMLGDLT